MCVFLSQVTKVRAEWQVEGKGVVVGCVSDCRRRSEGFKLTIPTSVLLQSQNTTSSAWTEEVCHSCEENHRTSHTQKTPDLHVRNTSPEISILFLRPVSSVRCMMYPQGHLGWEDDTEGMNQRDFRPLHYGWLWSALINKSKAFMGWLWNLQLKACSCKASVLVLAAAAIAKPKVQLEPAQSRKVCKEMLQRFVISDGQWRFWESEEIWQPRKEFTHYSYTQTKHAEFFSLDSDKL